MILFFSDIHLGKFDSRAEERALIECLEAYAPDVRGLYLLGDIFDQYIEFGNLIPKGFVRFQGLLARWSDAGIPITYFAGNHDPWHIDYMTDELGIRFIGDDLTEHLCGRVVYMRHGDGVAESQRKYNHLRPVLRHPMPVWLYRNLLPGDSGFRLARWVNMKFGKEDVHPELIAELCAHARDVLRSGGSDIVVMGHTHQPEYHLWEEGEYLNLGSWFGHRTFAVLNAEGIHLKAWTGTHSNTYSADVSSNSK